MKARYEITPLDGLRKRIGDKAEIIYARGYVGDPHGEYDGVVTGQDLSDSRSEEELREEAVRVAQGADIVLFFGGLNKSRHQDCEDTDRESLDLPYGQNELIEAIAASNPRIVVINISGTGVAMPWTSKVAAIVQAWYLGSETGNAIASMLAGDVNPCGKMPYTCYASLDQCGAHRLGEYPGHPGVDSLGNEVMDMPYNEGIYVGYRFTDRYKLKPTFSFGHGLSYTQFEYGKATVNKSDDRFIVSVPVTNIGNRSGKEVAQLYISDSSSSVEWPVKELKGFKKISIAPGETVRVDFDIDITDLSFFDSDRHAWVCEPGTFVAKIGSSSADIRSKVAFEVKESL